MSDRIRTNRWLAAGTAALLFLAGGAAGAAVDRHLLQPRHAHAMPLTVDAMADDLGLAPAERARLGALLDSLHVGVVGAMEHGGDSLRAAAQHAHARIEAALPPGARDRFREWIQGHHEYMMNRLHGRQTR